MGAGDAVLKGEAATQEKSSESRLPRQLEQSLFTERSKVFLDFFVPGPPSLRPPTERAEAAGANLLLLHLSVSGVGPECGSRRQQG